MPPDARSAFVPRSSHESTAVGPIVVAGPGNPAPLKLSAATLMSATSTVSSTWAPLRNGAFRALWLAVLVSNVATWMQTVGAQWRLPYRVFAVDVSVQERTDDSLAQRAA